MTVDYQLHLPEYLAKCINKSRPELHCNGQCELMKKIKEKEKKETEKNIQVYQYNAFYMHKEYTVLRLYQPSEESIEKPFSPYLIDYRFNYNTPVFRPPIA